MRMPFKHWFQRLKEPSRSTSISEYPVINTIPSKETGYILLEELEKFLEQRFPKEKHPLVPTKDETSARFQIQVSCRLLEYILL
jgi:hypothetical protein